MASQQFPLVIYNFSIILSIGRFQEEGEYNANHKPQEAHRDSCVYLKEGVQKKRSRGDHKTKGCPFAGGACDPDLSVVGLDDMFDNGESDPGASNLLASLLVHTVKPLKYPEDIFIRAADPVYSGDILNSIIHSRSFV